MSAKSNLINNIEQLKANIESFERARKHYENVRKGGKHDIVAQAYAKAYEGMLKKGLNFVPYIIGKKNKSYAFAPSRFLGYIGNDVITHKNIPKHGYYTTKKICEIIGSEDKEFATLEGAYMRFCRTLGVEPKPAFGKPRKFWPASKAISLRAVTQAEENEINKNNSLIDEDCGKVSPAKMKKVIETWVRNQKAVQALKELYGECQITGSKFVFEKTNGKPYLEVHHLVQLCEGGSDKYENLIVVSAHMHRMLHYANVTGLVLSKMSSGNKLKTKINGDAYTIRWKREHADIVRLGK